MEEQKKILLFGGTFNPIHNGHLIAARAIAEGIEAKKVCLIPNGVPPHKDSVLSLPHKMGMLELAISKDPLFEISRYEIDKSTPSYTLETVRFFKLCWGDTIDKPYWMIGRDNLRDLINWYKIEELAKECNFVEGANVFELDDDPLPIDPQYPDPPPQILQEIVTDIITIEIPHIDIRSTDIRERAQKGLSIKHLVPDAVEKYIIKHELYSSNTKITTV